MARIKYLKTEETAAKAVNHILIREQPLIGVKCLGSCVGEKGGRVTLVVVGCWDGNVYIFDTQKCPNIMYAGQLLRLLQSAEVLKVFANCDSDHTTLSQQFAVSIQHFYDAQIAHAIIMERSGLPARRLTLEQLCETYKQTIPSSNSNLQRLLHEDMNFWARRPVSRDMLALAAAHVRPLVPGIFVATDRSMPTDSDQWFTHQCEENRRRRLPLYAPPVNVHQAIKHCCTCRNCDKTRGQLMGLYSSNNPDV